MTDTKVLKNRFYLSVLFFFLAILTLVYIVFPVFMVLSGHGAWFFGLRDEGERIVENQNEKSVSSLQDVNGIEEAFAMLEKILARMDEDGVTLKESFDCYEQGMKLIKYCNETIDTVEKKVQILSAGGETDEF